MTACWRIMESDKPRSYWCGPEVSGVMVRHRCLCPIEVRMSGKRKRILLIALPLLCCLLLVRFLPCCFLRRATHGTGADSVCPGVATHVGSIIPPCPCLIPITAVSTVFLVSISQSGISSFSPVWKSWHIRC